MTTFLAPGAKVHIVGIGGAGMSGLARLLVEMGAVVSGSDQSESSVLDSLRERGVRIDVPHDAVNVANAEVVLWSPAVALDNVELEAARARGAVLLSRSAALAELGSLRRIIGLTGTHGKTTATSMLVHVLGASGRDDGRLLGAEVLGVGANGHWSDGDLLVEVDESFGTFGLLRPYALGLLNVEADHLDFYGSLETLDRAFTDLLDRVSGPVVVWSDDAGAQRVAERSTSAVVRVGRGESVDWRVGDEVLGRRTSSFRLVGPSGAIEVTLRVTGAHNVANAAVVAVLSILLGARAEDVVRGLARFEGAPRRFQYCGAWHGVDVYEDYAHLPGEISATLEATRAAGYERITAVFQPHRVTRTLNLGAAFAPAFDLARHVVVTDIYPAGEPNPDGVTGELVAQALRERRGPDTVRYCSTLDGVAPILATLREQSDVVVVLGAGDVGAVAWQLTGGEQ